MFRSLVIPLLLSLPSIALAQGPQLAEQPAVSQQAVIDPSDFLGSVPLLNEVPYVLDSRVQGLNRPPRHREHRVYHIRRRDVVAFSFIRDEPRRSDRRGEGPEEGRGENYSKQALEDFARGCTAQGGTLESVRSDIFMATFDHLHGGAFYWGWYNGAESYYPDFAMEVCTASPTQAVAALAISRDRLTRQTAIVLFAPNVVITKAQIDQEKAESRAAALREVEHLAAWRANLASGHETACGPVLSIKGDLVEVIETATRQPAWYRRNELRPARSADGRQNFCS